MTDQSFPPPNEPAAGTTPPSPPLAAPAPWLAPPAPAPVAPPPAPPTPAWGSSSPTSTPGVGATSSPAASGWGPAAGRVPASWPAAPPSGPPTPPTGADGVGGPGGPVPPRTGGDQPGPRRSRAKAAVAVALALAIGAGGMAAGVAVADRGDTSTAAPDVTAVSGRSVTTQLPPVSGDEAEPAAAVAKALGPAVVQIETTQGLGSGFVYDASGLILTAGHVTDGAATVQVRLADGTKATGEVLGQDDSTDVAVVKIDPPANLAVATLATGVTTEVGQTAIAIGSPFGLDQTVTAGIVSAVGRSVETPGGVIPAIQTDAPINSGNSGGALADRSGRVIGINDSIVTGGQGSSGGNVGVGFAIPIEIAKTVADKIVAGESTAAGFLGVEGADATGDRAGAAITAVSAGSPAEDAGITTSDVVTAADGSPVASMIDLAAAIRTHQPGDDLVLTVLRDGTTSDVTVTLGAATGR